MHVKTVPIDATARNDRVGSNVGARVGRSVGARVGDASDAQFDPS